MWNATLGRGGHSSEILKRCPNGHLYAFDRDQEAILQSRERLAAIGSNFTCIHSRFSLMKEELAQRGVTRVDGILMDLGVSSPQFDEASRGFSYRFDAPLDMRMDQSQPLDAWTVVNTYPYEDLCRVLFAYGEESFAKAIARGIERRRQQHSIDTTFELVDVHSRSTACPGAEQERPSGKKELSGDPHRGQQRAAGTAGSAGAGTGTAGGRRTAVCHQLPFSGRPHRKGGVRPGGKNRERSTSACRYWKKNS